MARYSVDYDGDLSTTDDRVSYGSFDAATSGINDRGFNSYSIQDNRRGGGGSLGSFSGDDRVSRGFAALNEARPVRQGFGGLFGGGGLLGGILGGQRFGYANPQGQRVTALQDMFNGGGAGMAGDTFQGGILSGLLNAIGVRPAGYRSRQMQPQMSEEQIRAQMGNAPSVMAPPPASTPSTAYSPAATPSPMYAPRGRPAPMSASPEYFAPGAPAPAAMTTAPMQPIQFGGQVAAPRPYVDVGMSDLGTVRPGVSRAGGRIPPLQGFTPNVNTLSTPRPAGMGLGPDAGRAATMQAFREMQRRALQAQGLLPR
jgi:hypothetical protein